jgi:hypothetical protein
MEVFKMKKFLALTLVLALALSLTACGNDNPAPRSGGGNTQSGGNNNIGGGGDTGNNSTASGSNSGGGASAGTVSNSAMESAVAAYLSNIGGPSSITLLSGSKIEYEPANEYWTGWGESWAISDPDISLDDLCASLESQLSDYGFMKDYGVMGYKYIIRAGSESIGVMVAMDGSRLVIYMTHHPECYNSSWIADQNAGSPQFIPGDSALDVLPDNFLISWRLYYGYKYTIARKDGNWLYCSDGREADDANEYSRAYYSVAIKQSDGSYKFYRYTDAEMTPKESEYFTSTTASLEDVVMGEGIFDGIGFTSNGSLSTWLQMSKDHLEGTSTISRFSVSSSMKLIGTENIAGVACDVVESGVFDFEKQDYAYDPATGILFRFGKIENDTMVYQFEVTEFNLNPSTLGNFPGEP